MTLPATWTGRRLRVPQGVVLHYADVTKDERGWSGSVPVTKAARTLIDCAASNVEPLLVRDAFEDAADRGLVERASLPTVVSYLRKFFRVEKHR